MKPLRILGRTKRMCAVRVTEAKEGLCWLKRGHSGPHEYWIYRKTKRQHNHRKKSDEKRNADR